jgi:hypothetical protein
MRRLEQDTTLGGGFSERFQDGSTLKENGLRSTACRSVEIAHFGLDFEALWGIIRPKTGKNGPKSGVYGY